MGSLSQQSACVQVCDPRSVPEAHINSSVACACHHSTGEAVTEETEIPRLGGLSTLAYLVNPGPVKEPASKKKKKRRGDLRNDI